MSDKPARLKIAAKVLVSLLFIYILARYFPVQQVGNVLKSADLRVLALCLLLGPVWYGLLAARLSLLLKYLTGKSSSYARVLLNYLYANALGYWLPSSFGMDTALVLIHKDSQGFKESLMAVAFNRLAGMASLLLMGSAGLFYFRATALFSYWPYAAGVAVILLAVFCLILRKKDSKICLLIREFAGLFLKNPALMLGVLLLACLNNLVSILALFLMAKSVGVAVPVLFCFFFVPFLQLVSLVPVTVANIGVQDVSFVAFFSKYAAAGASHALGISLLMHFFNVLYVCLAFILFNLENTKIFSRKQSA